MTVSPSAAATAQNNISVETAAAVTIPVQACNEGRTIRPTPTANQEAAQMLAIVETTIHFKCRRSITTDLLYECGFNDFGLV
jgi:hypothetical protein